MALPYDGTTQTDDLPKLFRLDPDAKVSARAEHTAAGFTLPGAHSECVLQKPSKDTLLSLFRSLKKLDTEKIFTHPVTDDEAPLYSVIILKPMTWTQIRKKIDTESVFMHPPTPAVPTRELPRAATAHALFTRRYETMQALADDFCLICKNAIVYNDAESEYNQVRLAHCLLHVVGRSVSVSTPSQVCGYSSPDGAADAERRD